MPKRKEYKEIPRAKMQEGIALCKKNIRDFLNSADVLVKDGKLDHATICAEFAVEELGKILMLRDEYRKNLIDAFEVPMTVFTNHKGKVDRAWQYLDPKYRMISKGGFERREDGKLGFDRGFEQVTYASHKTRLECAFVDFYESSNQWYVGRNIDPTKLHEQIEHVREKTANIAL